MNIVIMNTEARLIELPCVAPKVATGKEIVAEAVLDAAGVMVTPTQYMEPGALIAQGYDLQQLKPGENDVDDAYWALICSNPGVKILLAAKYLVNHGEGSAASMVEEIDKVDVSTGKSMILECTNIGLLSKWAETTDNRGLLKLIGERKDELIDQADGRVQVRGPRNPDVDLGTFGDNVTAGAADGGGEPAYGIGESGA